jgi:hypothetical protein
VEIEADTGADELTICSSGARRTGSDRGQNQNAFQPFRKYKHANIEHGGDGTQRSFERLGIAGCQSLPNQLRQYNQSRKNQRRYTEERTHLLTSGLTSGRIL